LWFFDLTICGAKTTSELEGGESAFETLKGMAEGADAAGAAPEEDTTAGAAGGEAAGAGGDAGGKKRMRDTELVVPICFGTCAYWLGKKADEYHSHKWTVGSHIRLVSSWHFTA